MSKRNVVIVLLFSFFAVFSLTACEIHNVNDVINNAASALDEKADAYRVACDKVREQLLAPSEAKFPSYDSSYVTECASDDTAYDTMYKINAYVDAQNNFGGFGRYDWSARVYHSKSNRMFSVYIDSLLSAESAGGNVDAGSAADDNQTVQNNGGANNNNNTYSSNYGSSSSTNNSTNNSSNNSTYRYDDYEDYEDEYDDYESDYGSYDDDDDYDDEYEEDDDSSSEYILPDSDSKKLTKYDLQGLTKAELRIARNEIYARHGRKFQDEALQDYFDEQDWYVGYIEPEDFVDSKMLSKLERRNAKFIMKFE